MFRYAAAFLSPNSSLHALLNIFFSPVNCYKIEFIAAFTLLGYMTAEMRGRKNERVKTTLGWIFFIAAASAIIIESAKIYPAFSSISILSIVIIISASICGAVIYRLQLSAIERLTL